MDEASFAERRVLVKNRDRFADAGAREERTYREQLDLERDVVPPLKLEAKRLRADVQRLDAEAAARGIDVTTIDPQVDWMNTISVDGYVPPRFESSDERRAAAVGFFRRLRES
jgi:hypothetical protein